MGINYRNMYSLAFAQVFGMSASVGYNLYGALVGIMLAPSKALVTLPVALLILGPAIAAVPSALLMEKLGRKEGQIVGAFIGVLGAVLSVFALYHSLFYLFCVSTIMIGMNNAFVQQYRFSVIEGLPRRLSSRAISALLFCNIISAYLGTGFIGYFKGLYDVLYTGAFLILAIMLFASLISLFFYSNPNKITILNHSESKYTQSNGAQRNIVPAIIIAALSYAIMTFVMIGAPVSMKLMHNMQLSDITFVIQSHITAMFLPSLFTGYLVSKYGNHRIFLIGTFCLAISAVINITGSSFMHYLIGLVFLGVGWNFSFICATTILTESYHYDQRFKIQAINDLVVFGLNAAAALLAGITIFYFGWQTLNIIALMLVGMIFICLYYIYKGKLTVP